MTTGKVATYAILFDDMDCCLLARITPSYPDVTGLVSVSMDRTLPLLIRVQPQRRQQRLQGSCRPIVNVAA
jgi:hypothetical protein